MTATLSPKHRVDGKSTEMVLNHMEYNGWGSADGNGQVTNDPDDTARWQSLLLLFSALRTPDARDRFSTLFSSSVSDDDGDAADLCAAVQELWAYEEASLMGLSGSIGRA